MIAAAAYKPEGETADSVNLAWILQKQLDLSFLNA